MASITSTPRRSTRRSSAAPSSRSASVDDDIISTPRRTPARSSRRSTLAKTDEYGEDSNETDEDGRVSRRSTSVLSASSSSAQAGPSVAATPRRRSARTSATPMRSLDEGSEEEVGASEATPRKPRGRPSKASAKAASKRAKANGDSIEAAVMAAVARVAEVDEQEQREVAVDVQAEPLLGEQSESLSPSPSPSPSTSATPPIKAEDTDLATDAPDPILRRYLLRRRLLSISSIVGKLLRPTLLLAGLVLLALLPSPTPPFSRRTYVDENALQPAAANNYWDWAQVGLCDELSREIVNVQAQGSRERAQWLSAKLVDYGLAPHTQDYVFRLPGQGDNATIAGTNTYARWLSGRSDGREAVIIAASWQSQWDGSDDPDVDRQSPDIEQHRSSDGRRMNVRGVSTLLGLAKYLTSQSYWSKDFIFVISDGYMEGMQAWSRAYFEPENVEPLSDADDGVPSGLQAEPVTPCIGAVVWNGVAIDYPSDSFDSLTVLHQGKDGQLPNMDVINTVLRIADARGRVPVRLPGTRADVFDGRDGERGGGWGKIGELLEDDRYAGWGWRGVAKYRKGGRNILEQVRSQVVGQPTGLHGLFQRYHVDAITLYANPAKGPYGFWHLGRILESQVTSYSNLIERLHHSQFFYLLTDPWNFVQLGIYLPASLLISIALTLTGISVWLAEGQLARQRQELLVELLTIEDDRETGEEGGDAPLEDPPLVDLQMQLAASIAKGALNSRSEAQTKLISQMQQLSLQGRPIVAALRIVGLCHLAGCAWLLVLQRLSVEDVLQEGLLGSTFSLSGNTAALLCIATNVLLSGWTRRRSTDIDLGRRRLISLAHLVRSFTLIQVGMVTAVVSVLNWSAATAMVISLGLPLYAMSLPKSGSFVELSDQDRGAGDEDHQDEGDEEVATQGQRVYYPFRSHVSTTKRIAALVMFVAFCALAPHQLALLYKSLVVTAAQRSSTLTAADALTANVEQWLSTTLRDWHIYGTSFVPMVALLYLPAALQGAVTAALVLVA